MSPPPRAGSASLGLKWKQFELALRDLPPVALVPQDGIPILNVFVRDGEELRHAWATELMFVPRDEGEDPRHVDSVWPIWSVLDMTPEGRGTESAFPKLRYG